MNKKNIKITNKKQILFITSLVATVYTHTGLHFENPTHLCIRNKSKETKLSIPI